MYQAKDTWEWPKSVLRVTKHSIQQNARLVDPGDGRTARLGNHVKRWSHTASHAVCDHPFRHWLGLRRSTAGGPRRDGLSKQLSRRYSTPPPPLLMRSSMSAAGSTWSVTRRDLLMVAAAASRSTCRTTCVRWAQSVSAVAARSDVRSTNPCRHGTPAESMMWPGAN